MAQVTKVGNVEERKSSVMRSTDNVIVFSPTTVIGLVVLGP